MRKGKEETPSMKNIFLDCGCSSKEEVEALGVHVGCVATFEDEFMILNKKSTSEGLLIIEWAAL